MLSLNDLNNGRCFVLKLWDSAGVSSQWVQTLRGDTARRWYDIYRNDDWEALRLEAPAVFVNPVTVTDAQSTLRARRCVFIHTTAIKVEQLGTPQP